MKTLKTLGGSGPHTSTWLGELSGIPKDDHKIRRSSGYVNTRRRALTSEAFYMTLTSYFQYLCFWGDRPVQQSKLFSTKWKNYFRWCERDEQAIYILPSLEDINIGEQFLFRKNFTSFSHLVYRHVKYHLIRTQKIFPLESLNFFSHLHQHCTCMWKKFPSFATDGNAISAVGEENLSKPFISKILTIWWMHVLHTK